MRLKMKLTFLAAISLLIGLIATPAHADTIPSQPGLDHRLSRIPDSPVYDYSVTMVQSGTTQHYYWCGYGDLKSAPTSGQPNGVSTDNIFTMSYDTATGTSSAVTDVLGPNQSSTAWDNSFVCNPGVVMGKFTYNGKSYNTALYYTATDLAHHSRYNRLGVAFTNDWHTFVKYPNPVLVPPCNDYQAATGGSYGNEMPTPYNADGQGNILLFHVQGCRTDPNDASTQHNVYLRATSTDGIHFTEGTKPVTDNGFVKPDGTPYQNPPNNVVFAYDKVTSEWYAVVEHEGETSRPSEGTYGFDLYKIKSTSIFSGATAWQKLTTVDTNLTGYEENFKPALTRDIYGRVNVGSYPDIQMQFGVLDPRPAADSTTAEDVASMNRMHWNIAQRTYRPDHPLLNFNRYFSPSLDRNEVTTGYVDTSTFTLESADRQLGALYEEPTGDANKALYGCRTDTGYDYYVSTDPGCEGHKVLGLDGYAYSADASGRVPLYRCYTGTFHLVSNRPDCEGQTNQGLLGYAHARA